jgi:hypothetical protein
MGRKYLAIFWTVIAGMIGVSYLADSRAQYQIWTRPAGANAVSSGAFPLLGTNGAVGSPTYSFSAGPDTGIYFDTTGGNNLRLAASGGNPMAVYSSLIHFGPTSLRFGSGVGSADVMFQRDAAGSLSIQNTTAATQLRVYGTTTGPKYVTLAHDGTQATLDTAASSGPLTIAGVNAVSVILGSASYTTGTHLRTLQQTVPTCTTNCGTSPSVIGSDTAGVITLGTTPASGFQLNFNLTWQGGTGPACSVTPALATMVVGKLPIAVVTTTTTMTVTTNGTAPATADKYSYICVGVS